MKKIRRDQLANELLVIFGPEMSANEAVAALKRVISNIEAGGLMIGRRPKDAEYMAETVGAKPRFAVA